MQLNSPQLSHHQQLKSPQKYSTIGNQQRVNNLGSQLLVSPLRSTGLQPQASSYFQNSNGFHNNLAGVITTNNVFKHTGQQGKLLMSPQVGSSYFHQQQSNVQISTSNSSQQVRTSSNNSHQVHSFKNSGIDSKTQQIEALVQENAKLVQIINEKNEQQQKMKPNDKQVEDLKEQLKQEQEQYVSFKKKVMLVIEENENLQNIYDQISKSYQQLEQQMNESNQLKTELAQDNQAKQNEILALQNKLQSYTEGSTDELVIQLREDISIQQGLITDYEQKINVLLEENDKMGQVIKEFNETGKHSDDQQPDKVELIKKELQELLARY